MSKLMVAALAGMALCGCASEQTAGPDGAVNTGLNALRNESGQPRLAAPVEPPKSTGVEKLAEEQKIDVQSILDRDPAPKVTAEVFPPPTVVPPDPVPEPVPEAPVAVTAPSKTLGERIDETSLLLTDLLRQNAAASESPFRAALGLAAMEAVRPGSAPKVITPGQTEGVQLNDEQRAIIDAFRDLVAGMATAGDDKPDELTDRAVELGQNFLRARPMRIEAKLAAKVTGFGQFMSLGTNKLQQGKPTRAVIYTEVRRFTQRPIKEGDSGRLGDAMQPGDKWAVELSQELQLIHDADGVKAWQQAEQPIIETSRSYRTDFYLVQNITLPPTLSIGAYKLKVIVRDKNSGHEDEAIIPIEVVADPSLITESAAKNSD